MVLKEAPLRPPEEQLRLLALHLRARRHGLLIVTTPDGEAEQTLAEETRRWLGDDVSVEDVHLQSEPVERLSLSHHLSTLAAPTRPAAVFVFGLDDLPSDARTTAINAMNWGRERLRSTAYTVVLWVRPGTPGELGNRAPDFFSWRSDVFQFEVPADPAERQRTIARLRLFAGSDLDEMRRRYCEYVIETCRWLDFRGVLQVRNIVRLPLDDVFVPPELTTTVEEAAPVVVEPAPPDANARLTRSVERRVPLAAALLQSRHLVILGDPGSGKSTALRFLALTYARGRGRVQERLGFDEDRLPILLPLAAFAEARARRPEQTIDSFIPAYCSAQGLPDFTGLFAAAIAAGRALVLFDGLDEMLDVQDRANVARAIGDFVVAHPDTRVVVSSRIVGYRGSLLPASFSSFTIAPLDDDGIKQFAGHWSRAFEAAGLENPAALSVDARRRAERRAESLVAAATGHPGVRSLATNPLLLTLLALVHQQGTRLPNRRADLYRLCVEALAETWNLARSLSGRPIDVRLGERRLEEDFVVRILAPVAYWMHETQPTGTISASELIARVADEFRTQEDVDAEEADRLARDFVSLAREQMGLLVERAPETFGFLHLTIQEYLAARFLSERRDSFARIRPRLHDPRWTEVVQLTAGTLRGDHAATFVEQILDAHVPHDEIAKRLPTLSPASEEPRRSFGQRWARLVGWLTGAPKPDLRGKELIRTLVAFLDVILGADCLIEGVTVPAALKRWTVDFVIGRWLDGTVNRHRWRPTLTRLGRDVAADEVEAALRRVLGDATPDRGLKAEAAVTLAEVSPRPETARVLLDFLTAPGESDSVRWRAAKGLGNIARLDADVRRMLLDILVDRTRESEARRYAAVALGDTAWLADDDVRVLLEIFLGKQYDAEVRRGAAEALGKVDHVSHTAEDALISVARDRSENQDLRFQSAIAASWAPAARATTFSALLELVQDPTEDYFVRCGALVGLGRDDKTRLEGLADTLLGIVRNRGEDRLLRGLAAEFLAATALDPEEAGNTLVALARDKAAATHLRRGALNGLREIGARYPPGLGVLVEVMRDAAEEESVRASAVIACAQLWRDDRAIIPALLDGVDDLKIHELVLSALFQILSEGGLQEIEQVTGPIDG